MRDLILAIQKTRGKTNDVLEWFFLVSSAQFVDDISMRDLRIGNAYFPFLFMVTSSTAQKTLLFEPLNHVSFLSFIYLFFFISCARFLLSDFSFFISFTHFLLFIPKMLCDLSFSFCSICSFFCSFCLLCSSHTDLFSLKYLSSSN